MGDVYENNDGCVMCLNRGREGRKVTTPLSRNCSRRNCCKTGGDESSIRRILRNRSNKQSSSTDKRSPEPERQP